jgi:hypothetical protein
MPLYGGYSLEDIAKAVRQIESSGGTNSVPRYEAGFQRRYGQKWLREGNAAFRRNMLQQFGPNAIFSSYGDYQVMYPVAVELGFTGTPEQLADPATNRQYFEKKFLRDWQSAGGNLQKTLLRYNGGGNPEYPMKVMRNLPQRQSALPQGGSTQMAEMPKTPEEAMEWRLFRADNHIKAFEQGLGLPSQGLQGRELASAHQQGMQLVQRVKQAVAQQQGPGIQPGIPQAPQPPQVGGLARRPLPQVGGLA